MSFSSSVEIEHAGDTRGDPNDRFEIGFEDQFHLTKTPNNFVVLLTSEGQIDIPIKKLQRLEDMSVYAG